MLHYIVVLTVAAAMLVVASPIIPGGSAWGAEAPKAEEQPAGAKAEGSSTPDQKVPPANERMQIIHPEDYPSDGRSGLLGERRESPPVSPDGERRTRERWTASELLVGLGVLLLVSYLVYKSRG